VQQQEWGTEVPVATIMLDGICVEKVPLMLLWFIVAVHLVGPTRLL